MLVAFGEFLRNNHQLLPAGWCPEWWIQLLEKSPKYDESQEEEITQFLHDDKISSSMAFSLSEKYEIPLHPEYTYFYHDVTKKDINSLRKWLYESIDDVNINSDLELEIRNKKRIL
jgi:DNA polymerase II large subunit